jgi:hypothetical protein
MLLAGSLSDRWGGGGCSWPGWAGSPLPPITGLTGAAYADPAQFRSSFGQIGWICAAASTARRTS